VTEAPDPRTAALDAYLAERAHEGFSIETRTKTQAVIGRRRRLLFVTRERLVVSVDEHCTVSSIEAEPVRW
jgi:hypothetical protein